MKPATFALLIALTLSSAPARAEGDDPATATYLTLGGILLPPAMMAVGYGLREPISLDAGAFLVLVGPSIGHIYTGDGGWALGYSAIRLVGAGVGLAGLWGPLGAGLGCAFGDDRPCEDEGYDAGDITLMAIGGAILVGADVAQVFHVRRSARANRRGPAVSLVPVVGPEMQGLTVVGSF